jgi:lambda family phage tail tape measure protein
MADINSTRVVITADDKTRAAFESAKAGLDGIRGSAAAISGVLAGVTAALAGLTVVGKFQDFVKGAAALDDMAEKTGASVEKLSALASVARVSGVEIQTVEAGLIKFAKALNGVDSETSKAQQAFKTLGLDPEKLRTLDTAEAFQVLAKRLSEFRDDGTKTAAVLEILGKSGAQLLPYIKDLAETGDLQAKVTAEQAAQAENLEKNLNRLFATKNAGFKEFSAAVLPTVDSFVKLLLDAANGSQGLRDKIKELTADGSIQTWARNTALTVGFLGDAFIGLKSLLESAGKSIAVLAIESEEAYARITRFFDTHSSPQRKQIQEARSKARLEAVREAAKDDLDALLGRTQFRDKLSAQFAQEDANRAGQEEGADSRPGKRSLGFKATGKETVAKYKDEIKQIESFVDLIGQRLIGATEGEFEQLRQRAKDVFAKVNIGELNVTELKRFRANVDFVTSAITQLEDKAIAAGWAKALAESFKMAGDAAEKGAESVAKFNEAQSQQAQEMEFELAGERAKLAAIRKIDQDAKRAQAALPENDPNFQENFDKIGALAEDSKAKVGALHDEIRTRGRDAWVGLSSASREYFDRVTNDAENMRSLLGDAFKGLEDAFVDFTTTGKLSFSKMADSIVADLARIAVRKNITGPLAQGLGGLFGGSSGGDVEALGASGGGGGFFDSIKNALGFAQGGRPPVGVPSIIGENGPELFIPDVSGVITPNSQLGGGGVTLVQNISIDSRSDRASIMSAMYQAKESAKAEIANMLSRNGQSGIARGMT